MTDNTPPAEGKNHDSLLRRAFQRSKKNVTALFCLSAAINMLALNGSLYMMLVYDKALPSQNMATLLGLFVFSTFIYGVQGLFEVLRAGILSDIARAFEAALAPRAIRAAHEIALKGGTEDTRNSPLKDLDQIRSFIAGAGPSALMDLPWIVFFLGILSLLHIWLGVAALAGAIVLIILTVLSEKVNKAVGSSISEVSQKRSRLAERMRRSAETLQSLGMKSRFASRYVAINRDLSDRNRTVHAQLAMISTSSRTTRMFIQSVLLTVGAWLVINGQVSGGIIFASSILAGRALAPIDQAIAQWRSFSLARAAWTRLDQTLAPAGEALPRTALPTPAGHLAVAELKVAPPGTELATIHDISFACEAGSIVGVIGPSGSGKSSLARALVGAWPLMAGQVRLDGATLDQWDPDSLGQHVGYLPQTVELIGGTVAENIARFDTAASSEDIVAAAMLAGVHALILKLPKGYETEVGEDGRNLSAGQRQRIGLARALFRSPRLVVLDEPNSNLDPAGEQALSSALIELRKNAVTALVVTHRQSVLRYCTHLLYIMDGRVRHFGPRDEVLAQMKEASNVREMSAA